MHPGVVPLWGAEPALAVAADVEILLRGPAPADCLPVIYGSEPPHPWTVRARN